MDDSTSDCQLNPGKVDYEFESNKVPEPLSVVDDQFVPKVRMTFTTLEDAGKVCRNYAKAAERENGNLKYLKQHRKLSMSIRCTIENNEEAGIRASKTYQSFVAAAGGHRELNFIEKDISMKTVIYGFQSIWITTSGQG
ncbi:Transposon protein [Arachis hypogaea]|nr:Transposon protein [Arachis hypogaea]